MGFGEIIFIMAIALILFGPEDLPKVARAVGKVIYEFRKLTHDFTREFENFIEAPEQKKPEKWSESFSEADHSAVENTPTQTKNSDPLAELPKDMVSYEEKDA
ncbi:MAG: twin-arginine translocase TatA/TatE family subunit [Desulfitobacteriaceae bacterium]